MGPRLNSRGNDRRPGLCGTHCRASMGPRLNSRGNEAIQRAFALVHGASMGPRLNSRGNPERPAADSRHPRLQWGRDLIVAETVILSAKYPSVIASFNGAAT